jgi:hypothetical protein
MSQIQPQAQPHVIAVSTPIIYLTEEELLPILQWIGCMSHVVATQQIKESPS